MRPESGFRIAPNWQWQWCHNFWHEVIVKFLWLCFFSLVKFSYWSRFHVNIITGSELWQFLFIRDSPEIRKSKKTPSEFCPISGDWGEWRIPNLAWTSLIKYYAILQNARVTAFTISELLRENQQGVKLPPPSHPD